MEEDQIEKELPGSKSITGNSNQAIKGRPLTSNPFPALDFVKIEKETNGYHWAQCMLGQCYEYGYGVAKDDKKRVEYYSLSSEQSNSVAMNNLGYCYEKGEGTDVNKTKAFEWYEKSANLGSSVAMNNVGMYYHNGFGGVTKDLNRAREWYTEAAAQGNTDAQIDLDELNAQ